MGKNSEKKYRFVKKFVRFYILHFGRGWIFFIRFYSFLVKKNCVHGKILNLKADEFFFTSHQMWRNDWLYSL